ncbi:MAG: UvrB/UvrC motif-containing protein [Verrucomicrobia bacterium]|nr:UvrB/UvrC motif-containing protein [Verrucomicrobiota bacterium]
MKCDFCESKASVFLTQLVEGQMKKVSLCDTCAQERGVTDPTGFSLADLLFSGITGEAGAMPASQSGGMPGGHKACPACGFTLEDLRRVRRFGCAECYTAFREDISPMLRGMHKGAAHVGKVPAGLMALQFKHQRLQDLRSRLDQAVGTENYEEAAGLRDEILTLNEPEKLKT